MDRRLELHERLEAIPGPLALYFQEPENTKMLFPCIVYKLDNERVQYASNNPYRHTKRWMVTVIDRDPDSLIPDIVARLPMTSFSRRFVADDLNHTIYTLYF